MLKLSKIEITLLAFHLLFGGVALARFEGGAVSYAVFTAIYYFLLVAAIRSRTSLGYMFFGVILWLGFWLKITTHIILSYPFVEPIGFLMDRRRSGMNL
ncbi:MAG: hypothetical protein IPM97_04615 [Bdellovibrionaceae bacterium]|nr:hypothetical protein [Pseudobdellovibrionaceae bacterium]